MGGVSYLSVITPRFPKISVSITIYLIVLSQKLFSFLNPRDKVAEILTETGIL